VRVFYAAHVRGGHSDAQLGERGEFAAVAAGESDGPAANGVGVLDGADHVGRIAGTADPHHQVARLGEVAKLLSSDPASIAFCLISAAALKGPWSLDYGRSLPWCYAPISQTSGPDCPEDHSRFNSFIKCEQ